MSSWVVGSARRRFPFFSCPQNLIFPLSFFLSAASCFFRRLYEVPSPSSFFARQPRSASSGLYPVRALRLSLCLFSLLGDVFAHIFREKKNLPPFSLSFDAKKEAFSSSFPFFENIAFFGVMAAFPSEVLASPFPQRWGAFPYLLPRGTPFPFSL